MRVTTRAYNNSYLNNYNSLLSGMLKSENKILTQRKYNRASEDSQSAAKAAHIRKSLTDLDIYDENCKTAKDLFYAAEQQLYDVANTTYLNYQSKMLSAQDTKNQTEFNILANEIEQLGDHMLQNMNSDFASRQMFGSTSNDKTPFVSYSAVKVFDKDGNEIAFYGNPVDDAATVGDPDTALNIFRMNDDTFYDKDGNAIDYTTAAADTELFDKDGVKYTVTADGAGSLKDIDGTAYNKVYTESQKYYDQEGKEILDLGLYDGDTYYDSADIENSDTVKFTVNGSVDASEVIKENIVCYNDVPINLSGNDLLAAVNGGTIAYYDDKGKLVDNKTIQLDTIAKEGNADAFPGSQPIYVDIGLGIDYTKLDSTSLDMSLNGAKITGYGLDDDGDSYNLIQIVYDTAAALRKGDLETVNRLIDKADTANTKVLNTITDLGIEQNNMDFYISKNSVYRLTLLDKQNTVEGVDIEAEITNWKTLDAAYNAALSMGSNILPKSLFDFI